MKRISLVTAAVLAIGLSGAPAVSSTQPAEYSTALTEAYGSAAPYTGTLRLTISSTGIVQGYYFSSDGSLTYVPVTGGKRGESIWLDIGNAVIYHVDGRLHGGTIVGTAFARDNAQYTFVADPQR